MKNTWRSDFSSSLLFQATHATSNKEFYSRNEDNCFIKGKEVSSFFLDESHWKFNKGKFVVLLRGP